MEIVVRGEFHPVANLFPMMSGAAFDELVADIKRNGLREPILVDGEGRILDGRNRYRACLAAGVEPRFEFWEGEGSLEDLALSLNLKRRHLNESQRAMVAARLAKTLEKEAVKRKSRLVANLPPADFGKSRSKAAGMVNVSARLISSAIKVLRDGCDELIAAVDAGALAVSTASVLAGLPKPEQAQAVAGGAKSAARQAQQLRAADRPAAPPCGALYLHAADSPPAARDGFAFLRVYANRLAEAAAALESRGFRQAPGA